MGYVVVALLSLAVGAVVYVLSLRVVEDEVVAVGFEPEPSPAEPPPSDGLAGPPPGYTYLQVAVTRGPSIRERLQGFVGSLALVAVAALGVAGTLYGIGVLVGRVIRSFIGQSGGP